MNNNWRFNRTKRRRSITYHIIQIHISILHTYYKIPYFDWIKSHRKTHINHCRFSRELTLMFNEKRKKKHNGKYWNENLLFVSEHKIKIIPTTNLTNEWKYSKKMWKILLSVRKHEVLLKISSLKIYMY